MSEQLLTTPQRSHRRKSPRSLSMREIIASYWDRSCWLPRRSPAGDPLASKVSAVSKFARIILYATSFRSPRRWYRFHRKHARDSRHILLVCILFQGKTRPGKPRQRWRNHDGRVFSPLSTLPLKLAGIPRFADKNPFDGNTFRRSDHT